MNEDPERWQYDLRGWCQVCGFLETSRRTILRWLRSDNPPPVRMLSNRIVASKAELREWGKTAAEPLGRSSDAAQ